MLCRAGDERNVHNKTGEIRYTEKRQQARDVNRPATGDHRPSTEIIRRERAVEP
jgi:hypothetical protein